MFAVPVSLHAQDYHVKHYTMRDGLPSMSIRCIYKDSRGLMWIGTDAGLCSYDGKSFRYHTLSEGFTASNVWSIVEDGDNNMWFGSFGDGLYKYDGTSVKRYTEKDGLVSDFVRVIIYSERFKSIYIGTNDGMSVLKGDSISSPISWDNNVVTGLAEMGEFIYVTTYGDKSPTRYYPLENRYVVVNDAGKYYPKHSFSVFLTQEGDTLLSNINSGVWFFRKDMKVQKFDGIGQVFSTVQDNRGDLWMAAWSYYNHDYTGGLYCYDGHSVKNFKSAFGILDMEIWTVYYDNSQDILWVCTLNEGLYKVPMGSIKMYSPAYFKLKKQKINSLYIDSSDNLWISGINELISLQPDGRWLALDKNPMLETYRNFWQQTPPNQRIKMSDMLNDALILDKQSVEKYLSETDFNFDRVFEDTPHSFMYSSGLGLFRRDNESGKTFYAGYQGYPGEYIASGDSLYVGCWGPTFINTDYKSYFVNYDKSESWPTPPFIKMNENGDPKNANNLLKDGNRIWYTTDFSGLWMSEGTKLTHLNDSDSTIKKSLNDICIDYKGRLIFGSNDGEVCIARYKDRKLTIEQRLSAVNGLLGNSVSWLISQNNHLWIGTNRGLNYVDLDRLYRNDFGAIRVFDAEEGYTAEASKEAVMDRQGILWVGSEGNLLRIDTRKLLNTNMKKGQVILTRLEVNDKLTKADKSHWNSTQKRKLILRPGEKNLAFVFDVLNYRNPSKDRFRYKLNGQDDEWHAWSTNRQATYTNLHPGNYKLVVESYNLSTNSHSLPLEVEFEIMPRWHELWTVRIILFLVWTALLILLIHLISERRRARREKQLETEQTIVNLKMQALQAQMNPHFIFNTINGIQYFVLANKMDKVLQYLSDFSKVIRGTLENAELKWITLGNEIDFLNSYLKLKQMRFPDTFTYEIKCDDDLQADETEIPPMLVQPYVENSVRHGFTNSNHKGRLSIHFSRLAEDVVKCTITDNGVGRSSKRNRQPDPGYDRLHSGQITETRLRLFNHPGNEGKYGITFTDLYDEGQPAGLLVEVFMPAKIGEYVNEKDNEREKV